MAVTFQVVLFAVTWVRQMFGDLGLLVSGAVLGLTDVDALTISMARSAASGVAAHIAAQAIAIGILANCVLKLTLALTLGTSRFRRVSGITLAAMALAIVVSSLRSMILVPSRLCVSVSVFAESGLPENTATAETAEPFPSISPRARRVGGR
jgi:uncharacterized membrane protein (DUF4010 family)